MICKIQQSLLQQKRKKMYIKWFGFEPKKQWKEHNETTICDTKLTRITSLWFFSSFLPMLLRNSFLSWVDPFSQPTLRKKKRLKNVDNSIRAFMRSLTQIVMSHVVDRVRFFKLFVDKKLWRSLFLKAVYSDAVCTRYYTRIWTM